MPATGRSLKGYVAWSIRCGDEGNRLGAVDVAYTGRVGLYVELSRELRLSATFAANNVLRKIMVTAVVILEWNGVEASIANVWMTCALAGCWLVMHMVCCAPALLVVVCRAAQSKPLSPWGAWCMIVLDPG